MAPPRDSLNLEKVDTVRSLIRDFRPEVIVNAAAYTAVDQAESDEKLAMAINARAPAVMAAEALRLDCLLVHYSTDYVFDGTKTGAYLETDPPRPLSVYGRSKLAGEQAVIAAGGMHLVLRTSWVYGTRGKNFLLTMLRLARERGEVQVVDDQFGAPTWCRWLAEATGQILAQLSHQGQLDTARARSLSGLYHLSAGERTSWCGFAREIFALAGVPCTVKAITTEEYPMPARRPSNSLLDNRKISRCFGIQLPEWKRGLVLCLEDLISKRVPIPPQVA